MVTATNARDKVVEALQAGVSDYVIKPFEAEYLRRRVRRLCQATATSAGPTGRIVRSGGPCPASPRVSRSSGADSAGRPAGARGADGKPVLTDVLRRIDEVSTIPQMALRFMQVANDPKSTMEDLTAVLANDPALTTRVLRLVNSAAFPVRQKITHLQQAIAYLGLKQVRNLGIAITVSDLFKARGSLGPYNRSNLWRHMVAVGIGARSIARRLELPNCEEFFLAGLVHDIGIVFEDQYVHQQFCQAVRSLAQNRLLIEQEHDYMAFDHTQLGACVAEQWGLPAPAKAAIRHHHASASFDGEDKLAARCVELANVICSEQGITSVGMNLVSPVRPKDLELAIDDDELASVAQAIQNEVAQASVFLQL